MVRLKADPKRMSSNVVASFQFQDGAIKGLMNIVYTCNSATFQFQDGAIKGHLQINSCAFIGNFNSKMVRLKVSEVFDGIASEIPFQFQDGAIKGVVIFVYFPVRKVISIPRWCD